MKMTFGKYLPLVAAVTLLASCGNNKASAANKKDESANKQMVYKKEVKQKGKAIKGGELKYALVSDTPIKGIFNPYLSVVASDSVVTSFFSEDLFTVDKTKHFTNDGFAKFDVDEKNKVVTVKFPKDVKWSDGKPMSIDDYIFTHEFIANKDYPGVRYPAFVGDIEGAEEYHAGKADHISGIEKVDDQTVKLHYKKLTPAINIPGGQLVSGCLPKHVYKDIPMSKVMESDAVRKNPVSFGPFKIQSVIPGESVTLVANEHYYLGRPNLDKVTVDVVSTKNIVSEMKNGNYDIASMPADSYDSYKDAKNFTVLTAPELSYNYIAFKFGKWNPEKKVNESNEHSKMNNKNLRQAMAYAIDTDKIAKKFYNGTRAQANSLIPPVFDEHDDKVKPYQYNPKKAKQLLDEAGYKDKDGDGFREDPKGKKLVINYLTPAGGENDQSIALALTQWWEKIGLKVKLVSGRPVEFNSYIDKLRGDDPQIDVYAGAWALSGDPDPSDIYGRHAELNVARFTSEENDKLLADISSEKAFDQKYRKEALQKWQEYAAEEAFVVPTLYRTGITAVNNRIKYFDVNVDSLQDAGSLNNLAFVSKDRVK
ncbi:oligopeptide ABC transporter substrate-binding protein [Atopobacter sp. AH10]|uniref:oligopeptide ABC transporter substrate-binding protein n=1 Tax=Atopobacter sp. AH10 TaxID=2315861 RepID=UPI000EF1D310|nr:oligopeptide ABC transporter substrate-binding protein [Atopobacter sp. AH10]RLK64277.1 oligopeptide ABC transporter substrate-binding protein [Atopobacter sp. AH10]